MKTDELVFVLAATNLPWELDAAMLRRLEKRVSFEFIILHDWSDNQEITVVCWNHCASEI